ncbi:Ribosome biogenesis regulatory protein-like [Cricetulus griseus]|uniref:Ribosome biogenesis regulatory protein-like n=1 Tax=Cricetulus griseus TaxID=10029 RepID=G3IG57_CRIGR|nr:Ribosome biogenesis regulatory protein-like [Cricetulus griseus]
MEGPNVDELLAKVEPEAAEKLPGIAVHKELELELDLGNLLASDHLLRVMNSKKPQLDVMRATNILRTLL